MGGAASSAASSEFTFKIGFKCFPPTAAAADGGRVDGLDSVSGEGGNTGG